MKTSRVLLIAVAVTVSALSFSCSHCDDEDWRREAKENDSENDKRRHADSLSLV